MAISRLLLIIDLIHNPVLFSRLSVFERQKLNSLEVEIKVK